MLQCRQNPIVIALFFLDKNKNWYQKFVKQILLFEHFPLVSLIRTSLSIKIHFSGNSKRLGYNDNMSVISKLEFNCYQL